MLDSLIIRQLPSEGVIVVMLKMIKLIFSGLESKVKSLAQGVRGYFNDPIVDQVPIPSSISCQRTVDGTRNTTTV